MLRTIVLAGASLSIILAGFAAYTYQDPTEKYAESLVDANLPDEPFSSLNSTGVLEYDGVSVPGGEKPAVKVWTDDGEARYQFRATTWEPIREDLFRLVDPEIAVFMPGGQITRIRADHGETFLERLRGNNLTPRRGKLWGNVLVFVDRSDKAWRKKNPDKLAPEDHPELIIKIWLDEVTFDLDQSLIKSPGHLRVQCPEVEIEGFGLTLAWNERDNRVEELVIERGNYMELRKGGNMVSFGLPGQNDPNKPSKKDDKPDEKKQAVKEQLFRAMAMKQVGLTETKDRPEPSAFVQRAVAASATANKALSIEEVYPTKKQQRGATTRRSLKDIFRGKKLSLFDKPTGRRLQRKGNQLDTYLAVLEGDVVVEQVRGLKMLGRLSGVDRLALVFDVGESQRQAVRSTGSDGDEAEQADEESPEGESSDAGQAAVNRKASVAEGEGKDGQAPTTQPAEKTRLRLHWKGRLELRPVEPDGEQTGKRFDAYAFGDEVRIEDQQGVVLCKELIFSNETERAWLKGGQTKPVRMWADDNRKLQGQKIYLDRKMGLALFQGPGSMSDTRKALESIGLPDDEGGQAPEGEESPEGERIELNWSDGAQLEFGPSEVTLTDPTTGRQFTKTREHIKEASFRGDVRMRQGNQEIRAHEVVMTMGPPTKPKAFVGPILSVRANGEVALIQEGNDIRADKLSVNMAVDEHGRNIPKSATAYGNVKAKQGGREIRAKDMLSVVIGEVERPEPTTAAAAKKLPGGIDPAKLTRVKQLAALRGIDGKEIDELVGKVGYNIQAFEAFAESKGLNTSVVRKLLKPAKPKLRLSINEMHAFGDVVAVDTEQKMDVQAEELHCTVPDGKMIDRATVIAKPNEQSRVKMEDYVIHGHRIEVDADRQYAEVPDKGWLRFESKQGLDGEKLDKPMPIRIEWSKEMRLEGAKNVGRFIGDVVAESETSRMECDRLRIDLVDMAPAEIERLREQRQPEPTMFEQFRKAVTDAAMGKTPQIGRQAQPEPAEPSTKEELRRRFAKRPMRVLAEGNVVVVSSMMDKNDPKRLLSRMRIAGPKLTVDLQREQMEVTGAGSLLIEDYRLPASVSRSQLVKNASRPKNPLMGNIASNGPSQTAFMWANSMTYFLANNLAVLDRSVHMRHLSGGEVVMGKELAKAMDVDLRALKMKGRRAELTCENLTVEFLQKRDEKTKGKTPFDVAGATELQRLIATGNVYIEDSGTCLVGEELTYFRDKNEITVVGTKDNQARLFIEDPKGKQFMYPAAPMFRWNRSTGEIWAPNARIVAVDG